MARIAPFEKHAQEYEKWFEVNSYAYESELRAVRSLLPRTGRIVEVGVGSGRFAAPLGITLGVEPSAEMRRMALARGIEAMDGTAESLPFDDATLDALLMVTTVCFLDDVNAAFEEAHRVLKPAGSFVLGFVDRASHIGQLYERTKDANPFYSVATFYSFHEVIHHLKKAGFKSFHSVQTIFHDLEEITHAEPVTEGHGEGSFVVIKAGK